MFFMVGGRHKKLWLSALAVLLVAQAAWGGALLYRPGREFRTITTASYELKVQKNGRVDITLTSGEPVFQNAFPMVWLEGEGAHRPLAVEGRWSLRQPVSDPLGQGHGVALRKKDCEWSLRTYPHKPFFVVKVEFINTSRKPTRVRALLPWCVGQPIKGALSLGPGTADALSLGTGSKWTYEGEIPVPAAGNAFSPLSLATVNPRTGRSLIAGFLTQDRAIPQIRLERGAKAEPDVFDLFRAECLFDPPIEVPPNGRLASEVLYLSVGETYPLDGLEGYAQAVALVNRVSRTRPFMPHTAVRFGENATEKAILHGIDYIDAHLKRYGWNHILIDSGWELRPGQFEPDPQRFPHGFRWLVDQVHARGMTAGLAVTLFRIDLDAPVAQEHPDWLAPAEGHCADTSGQRVGVLDITAPGADLYIRHVCATIGQDWGWGFDSMVETGSLRELTALPTHRDASLTRVEVLRKALQAVNAGLGERKFVALSSPYFVPELIAAGANLSSGLSPLWHGESQGDWGGCAEILVALARRYYAVPYSGTLDPGASIGLSWSRDQHIAWLTGLALLGSVIRIDDSYLDLAVGGTDNFEILRKVLPVAQRPARPIDLFDPAGPHIWALPVSSSIGEWCVVGLFNWDESAETILTVPFDALRLRPDAYYTVFDFWEERYHGTARQQLTVAVPPSSVRLLGLRPYEDRPMFVAINSHFSQGATDCKDFAWDERAKRLSGIVEGIESTSYNLYILCPHPYVPVEIVASANDVATTFTDNVLKLSFYCPDSGPIPWHVTFTTP